MCFIKTALVAPTFLLTANFILNTLTLSSTMISLVRKSAPIVALYCDVKRLDTYWFIREVFPTLQNSEGVLERGD